MRGFKHFLSSSVKEYPVPQQKPFIKHTFHIQAKISTPSRRDKGQCLVLVQQLEDYRRLALPITRLKKNISPYARPLMPQALPVILVQKLNDSLKELQ